MGAYSSWGMLALTHHFIVQMAYRRQGGIGRWFTDYVVLGDDIVIANQRVAKQYLDIMSEMGVGISFNKTLSTSNGVFEFAKRLVAPHSMLQGLPLKALGASRRSFPIFIEFLKGSGVVCKTTRAMSLLGFGYRVRGRLHKLGSLPGRAGLAYLMLVQPHVTDQSRKT